MTVPSNIHRNVMRRVHIIRITRPFISNAALSVYLLGASLYVLGREVFVAQIVRNMPAADPAAMAVFIESAFLNTTVVVQVLTVLALVTGCLLARECARMLRALSGRLV